MEIDLDDLASLGIKENYESFLKKTFRESLEFGMEMSEEDLKLMKKWGMNPEELKEGIKPIHKDLDEDQLAEVCIFSGVLFCVNCFLP